MVNATIDNSPVSVTLSSGQITTVPSNEVWKVSISLVGLGKASNTGVRSARNTVSINGTVVLMSEGEARGGSNNASASSGTTLSTVLVGNDTVEPNGRGTHIGGFVVQS